MVLQHFSAVEVCFSLDVLLGSDDELVQLILEFESDCFEVFRSAGVHFELLHGLIELGHFVALVPPFPELRLGLSDDSHRPDVVVDIQDFLPESNSKT